MVLRRHVQEDVKRAIKAKDTKLDEYVANMNEDQLERTLTDCVPSGMDDLSAWKRDRQKRSWRHLSAFGVVRNDSCLYHRWKQQRRQRVREIAEGRNEIETTRPTTCAIDADRRRPWSTDLYYTRRCLPGHNSAASIKTGGSQDTRDRHQPQRGGGSAGYVPCHRKIVKASAPSRPRTTRRTRSASAPPEARGTITTPPEGNPTTTRTPSLAKLARVFYWSSVASRISVPGMHPNVSSHRDYQTQRGHTPGGESSQPTTSAQKQALIPEEAVEDVAACRGNDNAIGTVINTHPERTSMLNSTRDAEYACDEIDGVKRRLEEVRVLWAVSQLSTEAVTRKIMYGYSERQRAREPNRQRWGTPSRTPQPPGKTHEGSTDISQGRERKFSSSTRNTGEPQGFTT